MSTKKARAPLDLISSRLSSVDASYYRVTDLESLYDTSGCREKPIWILDNEQYFPPILQEGQSTLRSSNNTCPENAKTAYVTIPKYLLYLKLDHIPLMISKEHCTFFNHTNVKYLDISHRFSTIKAQWNYPIFGLYKLETLNASSFGLSFISMLIFHYTPSLKVLDLSNNYLDDSVFQHPLICEPLEHLNLAENQFQNVSSTAFSALANLRSLHLQGNNIEELNFLSESLNSLKYVDLSKNKITRISDEEAAILDYIYNTRKTLVVDLDSNPLMCNCESLSFIRWVQTTQVLSNKELLWCSPPEQRLLEVDVETLRRKCHFQPQITIIGGVGGCVMFVLAMVSLAYRFRWWLKWKYYNFKLFRVSSRDTEMNVLVGSEDFYSAYVIYSHNDDTSLKFLVNDLRLKVEHHFQKPAMYFYGRDDIPGKSLLEDMICGLRASRAAIWVITLTFLADKLCETAAHFAIAHLGRKNNLLILLKNTFDEEDITQEYVNLLDPNLGLKKIVFSEDVDTAHLNVLWQEVDQFLSV